MSLKDLLSKFKAGRGQTYECTDSLASLREWLVHMPLANVAKAAQSLLEMLESLAASDIEPRAAAERFLLFHPYLLKVSDLLKQHYLKGSKVVIEEKRTLALMARDMHFCALTICYTLSKKSELEKKRLAEILSVGLVHAEKLMRSSFFNYTFLPPQTWQMQYGLYYQASAQEYLANAEDEYAQELMHTIVLQFKINSLLGMSQPYKLSPGKMDALYEVVVHWAPKVSIRSTVTADDTFVFSIDSDAPPTYQSLIPTESIDSTYYTIDIDNIISNFETLLSQASRGGTVMQETGLSAFLVAHLYQIWRAVPSRRAEREVQNGKYFIISGLAATSLYFREHFGLGDSELFAEDVSSDENQLSDDFSTLSFKEADYFESAQSHALPEKHPVAEWSLVNVSQGGICLQSTYQGNANVMAGQVVGLRNIENPNVSENWQLGLVRWVQCDEAKNSIMLGAQVISHDGYPVYLQNMHQYNSGHHLAGILSVMPETPIEGSILLTPTLPYNEDEEIILQGQHYHMRVKLQNCIEASSFYKIFSYEVIEHVYS